MVRAYHINQGGPTARTDTVYLFLVGTSTMALIAMLMSSYTCKFAAVTEIKMATNNLQTEAHSIPAYFGIWQVQNAVADQSHHHHHHHHDMTVSSSEFIVQETNDNNDNDNSNEYQCIAWGDTLWDESGSVRASKIYSLTATVVGVALVACILAGTRVPLNSNMIFALCTVSLVCEALSALYFEVLGAQPCFQYGLQCHWHVGAYYASAAVLLWMTTAIGFALYQPKLVAVPEQQQQQGQGNTAQPNGTDVHPNTVVAQGNAGTNHNNSHGHDNSPTTPMDEEVGSAALLQTTVNPVDGQCSGCNNNNNNNNGTTRAEKKKRSLPGDTDQESISTADTPFRLSSFDDDDDDDDDDDEEVIDSLDQEVGTNSSSSSIEN